jgi:3-hydroxyisobutyrate dehydrogenase/2-hydroxy-3-oxopropionate reductase
MSQKESVGYLGLGIMGYPMAANLLKAGCQVTVYNRTAGRASGLEQLGARVAGDAGEVAASATLIFLCVGGSEDVEKMIGKLLPNLREGSLVVDTSTISPTVSRRIAAKLAERHVQFLDAPCTGSKAGATNATLTFMVGGEKAGFERALPYFEMMGKKIFHIGGQGTGLQVKLTQNLIGALTVQAMAEGFVLARKAGISPSLVLEVLQNSVARNPLIDGKLPLVLERNFAPAFSLKWMHKDLGLMMESAAELNVPLPVTALTRELFGAGIAMGHGEQDFAAAVCVMEALAGTQIRER